jgi:Glycosyl transferase family 2
VTTPIVSALIDTYNQEHFLEQALASVLEQGLSPSELEIVVVDDGSTDNTASLVAKFAPRVRYIRKKNGGQVSAFNAGVPETHAPIVATLDGDDWWAKGKLRAVLDAFEQNPGIAAVGHAYHEVDESGKVCATMIPARNSLSLRNPSEARSLAPLRVFLGTSRLAIRRAVLDQALPIPAELPFFDNFVFTQAIAISGALLLQESLCYYRLHSRNLYASVSPNQEVLRTKYRLLRGLLQHLPPRLSRIGVPEETVSALLAGDRLEANQLHLLLEGGRRIETFRTERDSFRLAYQDPDLTYKLFKDFVLLLTLLLPPRAFYRLRRWYADHGLRSLREHIGGAYLSEPEVVRPAPHVADKTVNLRSKI